MTRPIKGILLSVGLIALTIGLGSSWWAIQQTKQIPAFYEEAKQVSPLPAAEASRRLRAEVQQLQDNASRLGSWQAAFSDQQINAWLMEEIPEMFPRLLAKGASEPRIKIEDDHVLAAVRFQHGHIDTVISCQIHVEMTEQPNMLAVRVSNLRAGALPLPLHRFLRGITKEAARGGLDIRWDITETGPVALATVPSEDPRYSHSPVVIESLNLTRGALYLSGHTGELATEVFEPSGPVHKFVSYQPGANRNRHPSRLSRRTPESASTVR